jgi:hypothetical protein
MLVANSTEKIIARVVARPWSKMQLQKFSVLQMRELSEFHNWVNAVPEMRVSLFFCLLANHLVNLLPRFVRSVANASGR